MTDDTEEVWTCRECGRQILPGEAVHGAYWDDEARQGLHYECSAAAQYKTALERFEKSAMRVGDLLKELRSRLR